MNQQKKVQCENERNFTTLHSGVCRFKCSVYYSLKFFYAAIESTIVSGILQQATRLAGRGSDKFTAISFRSIGATTAIGNNIGPLLYKN